MTEGGTNPLLEVMQLAEKHGIAKRLSMVNCPHCHMPSMTVSALNTEPEYLCVILLCVICGVNGDVRQRLGYAFPPSQLNELRQRMVWEALRDFDSLDVRGRVPYSGHTLELVRAKAIEVKKLMSQGERND